MLKKDIMQVCLSIFLWLQFMCILSVEPIEITRPLVARQPSQFDTTSSFSCLSSGTYTPCDSHVPWLGIVAPCSHDFRLKYFVETPPECVATMISDEAVPDSLSVLVYRQCYAERLGLYRWEESSGERRGFRRSAQPCFFSGPTNKYVHKLMIMLPAKEVKGTPGGRRVMLRLQLYPNTKEITRSIIRIPPPRAMNGTIRLQTDPPLRLHIYGFQHALHTFTGWSPASEPGFADAKESLSDDSARSIKLCDAVVDGNVARVTELLDEGADPDKVVTWHNEKRITAMYIAAMRDHRESLVEMVKSDSVGSDKAVFQRIGTHTALTIAAAKKHVNVVKVLLANLRSQKDNIVDVIVNKSDLTRQPLSAILIAMAIKTNEVLRAVISALQPAQIVELLQRDIFSNFWPLQFAVMLNSVEKFAILLERLSATERLEFINHAIAVGKFSLDESIYKCNEHMLVVFLENLSNADVSRILLHTSNAEELPIAIAAAKCQNVAVMDLILLHLDQADVVNVLTLLQEAAYNIGTNTNAVMYLLLCGGKNLNEDTESNDVIASVRNYVFSGGDVECPMGKNRVTRFMYFMSDITFELEQAKQTTKAVLPVHTIREDTDPKEHEESEPNSSNLGGHNTLTQEATETPAKLSMRLCHAAEVGNVNEVENLLVRGADPNRLVGESQRNAFYCALKEYRNEDVVADCMAMLVNASTNGSDAAVLQRIGMHTALTLATVRGFAKVVDILLSNLREEKHHIARVIVDEGGEGVSPAREAIILQTPKVLSILLNKLKPVEIENVLRTYMLKFASHAIASTIDMLTFASSIIADGYDTVSILLQPLEAAAKSRIIQHKNERGYTPLFYVFRKCDEHMVSLFLEGLAPTDVKNILFPGVDGINNYPYQLANCNNVLLLDSILHHVAAENDVLQILTRSIMKFAQALRSIAVIKYILLCVSEETQWYDKLYDDDIEKLRTLRRRVFQEDEVQCPMGSERIGRFLQFMGASVYEDAGEATASVFKRDADAKLLWVVEEHSKEIDIADPKDGETDSQQKEEHLFDISDPKYGKTVDITFLSQQPVRTGPEKPHELLPFTVDKLDYGTPMMWNNERLVFLTGHTVQNNDEGEPVALKLTFGAL